MDLPAVKGLLFGAAIGDALGVPVEFTKRAYLKENPVKDFIGYGTHNKPPGTFSDDASLTFCLAEAVTGDFTLAHIARNFINWAYNNYWAADTSFGFGQRTLKAIFNLRNGIQPEYAGGTKETDNGNGSLMRISPLVFYIYNMPIHDRFDSIRKVASITHGHIRSIIACFYYLEFMVKIAEGKDLFKIYKDLQTTIPDFLASLSIDPREIGFFDRLLKRNIYTLSENEIKSGGYVIETLEASIWCLLTAEHYEGSVLKAVNLAGDADTTGCVTGAIAGLYYGFSGIPERWVHNIMKHTEIEDLAERVYQKIGNIEPSGTLRS
ncbi:MAG: ADP-ribosylglycohydrolase family protein [Treponema sp.]|jgi:ADP-ribosylglycohydrolase|nr:ADP-ribosylglycohydrolase family protein [Treponema sp.]